MSKADDSMRTPKAVVACLRDNGDGTSKLIFDEVDGDSINNPIEWSFACFYTWLDYDNRSLDEMKLSDREYQMIGENLIAGLLALNGRIDEPE